MRGPVLLLHCPAEVHEPAAFPIYRPARRREFPDGREHCLVCREHFRVLFWITPTDVDGIEICGMSGVRKGREVMKCATPHFEFVKKVLVIEMEGRVAGDTDGDAFGTLPCIVPSFNSSQRLTEA